MNKHIELVKKWLADPASVSQQELKDNRNAADACAYAANYPSDYTDAYAAYAARAAAAYVYAYVYAARAAAYWVERYEELTK